MANKFDFRASLSLKLFIIGFLIAILMIPTGMIAVLVNERENRQDKAFREVSEKWGRAQSIGGPVLSIPYKKILSSSSRDGVKSEEVLRYAHFLPEKLNIDGIIKPEIRKRGIYELAVYRAELAIRGEFSAPDFSKWDIAPENIFFERAFVSLGIPDVRGIKENVTLQWGEKSFAFAPGIETNDVFSSGLNSPVEINRDGAGKKYSFSLDLALNGSRDLFFSPIGRETKVHLASEWKSPSFQGAFLPDNYSLNEQGFSADWKVLELNRSWPQSFLGTFSAGAGEVLPDKFVEPHLVGGQSIFSSSDFGLRLLLTADEYQKTVRALKYSIMLLSLTFLILFFFEAFNKKRVHALQYILIGLALSLFYVLLLSLAEQIGFDWAYLVSASSIVVLIFLYSKSIFKKWRPAMIEGLLIVFIYAFIYVILQLEDYSLLVGAIGLFVILAIIMFVSRKIDWYGLGSTAKDELE